MGGPAKGRKAGAVGVTVRLTPAPGVTLMRPTMTARVKGIIDELPELSPPEMAELASRLRELRAIDDSGPRPCRNADLIRFFESHTPDPEFADDIEAGIRERRARAEDATSHWDR